MHCRYYNVDDIMFLPLRRELSLKVQAKKYSQIISWMVCVLCGRLLGFLCILGQKRRFVVASLTVWVNQVQVNRYTRLSSSSTWCYLHNHEPFQPLTSSDFDHMLHPKKSQLEKNLSTLDTVSHSDEWSESYANALTKNRLEFIEIAYCSVLF